MSKIVLSTLFFILSITSVNAASVAYPFYGGVMGGYGSTDWSELVNHDTNPDHAPLVLNSSPLSASDKGFNSGVFIGYTFTPNYALELSYRNFKTTKIKFDVTQSLYQINGVTIDELDSDTTNFSLINKIIWPFAEKFSVYSGLGPGLTHRKDLLCGNKTHVVATFAAGLDYNITDHVMTGIEGDYTTGWGKAELYPVHDYIPFLYSVDLKLGYRF